MANVYRQKGEMLYPGINAVFYFSSRFLIHCFCLHSFVIRFLIKLETKMKCFLFFYDKAERLMQKQVFVLNLCPMNNLIISMICNCCEFILVMSKLKTLPSISQTHFLICRDYRR